MLTCETCAHWLVPQDTWREDRIIAPIDEDTFEPKVMPFEVRRCCHPALAFAERPVETNGFALCDGSQYWAALYTGPEFGCVRHEPTPAADAPLPDRPGHARSE